ncbi:MAG: hypothetical protein HRF46_05045, partial [Acidobacteriota bacterium]
MRLLPSLPHQLLAALAILWPARAAEPPTWGPPPAELATLLDALQPPGGDGSGAAAQRPRCVVGEADRSSWVFVPIAGRLWRLGPQGTTSLSLGFAPTDPGHVTAVAPLGEGGVLLATGDAAGGALWRAEGGRFTRLIALPFPPGALAVWGERVAVAGHPLPPSPPAASGQAEIGRREDPFLPSCGVPPGGDTGRFGAVLAVALADGAVVSSFTPPAAWVAGECRRVRGALEQLSHELKVSRQLRRPLRLPSTLPCVPRLGALPEEEECRVAWSQLLLTSLPGGDLAVTQAFSGAVTVLDRTMAPTWTGTLPGVSPAGPSPEDVAALPTTVSGEPAPRRVPSTVVHPALRPQVLAQTSRGRTLYALVRRAG